MALYKLINGKHYLRNSKNDLGRCLIPGDTIECEEYELGGALDKFIRLDPTTIDSKKKKDQLIVKQSRRNKNQYNVHHPVTGDKLNSNPLTKEEAEEMAGGILEDN